MTRILIILSVFLSLQNVYANHGLALGYTPKYPSTFTHFDYVNPNAPKKGRLSLPAIGSFDSINPFTIKGDIALGIDSLTLDTLMQSSWDEPFSMYGLLAEDVTLAPDGLSVTFKLNRNARFHNGDPVLAKDVVYSFNTLTKDPAATPLYRFYWAEVAQVIPVDNYTVRFDFKRRNAELHMILGQLPVFSHKSFKNGLENASNVLPIGSGPYKLGKVNTGKLIEFKRDPKYWGQNIPSRKGMFNFDEVRFKYYKDDTTRLEAFKAGEFDIATENVARNWARGYNGAKFDDKRILKDSFKHQNSSGMQGFVFNQRNPILKDKKVRQALSLAFDFEWVNRQLFYSQYSRSNSFFTNSELAATGAPSKEELKLLEPLRKGLPAGTFGIVPSPPKTDPKLGVRPNLLKARALLEEAGYSYKDGQLFDKKGQPLTLEFLSFSKTYERVTAKWQKDLAKIGVKLTVRIVDPALFQKRVSNFDYDITVVVYGASQSPGNEQLNFHSCAAAKVVGSQNWAGYCNPAVDKLLQNFIQFDSRANLVTASRALDRVLLSEYLLVPNWYTPYHRLAWWNKFEHPQTLPKFYDGTTWATETWWMK